MAKKITISLPDVVMKRLDEESEKLGLNRSAYISMALNQNWNQTDAVKLLPEVLQAVKTLEIAQNGSDAIVP